MRGTPAQKILNQLGRVNVLKGETTMKKLFLMLAVLLVLGFSTQARAGVHVSVGIGFGGGGYYAGPPPYYGYPAYYAPYPPPPYYYYGPPGLAVVAITAMVVTTTTKFK
jgi:hypothetical protein